MEVWLTLAYASGETVREVLFFTGLELIFHSLNSDHCVYCVILQVKGHRKEDGLGNSAGCFGRCE